MQYYILSTTLCNIIYYLLAFGSEQGVLVAGGLLWVVVVANPNFGFPLYSIHAFLDTIHRSVLYIVTERAPCFFFFLLFFCCGTDLMVKT